MLIPIRNIQKLLTPLFRVYFIGVPNSYELVQDGLCIQNMVILQNTYRPTQCACIIMIRSLHYHYHSHSIIFQHINVHDLYILTPSPKKNPWWISWHIMGAMRSPWDRQPSGKTHDHHVFHHCSSLCFGICHHYCYCYILLLSTIFMIMIMKNSIIIMIILQSERNTLLTPPKKEPLKCSRPESITLSTPD